MSYKFEDRGEFQHKQYLSRLFQQERDKTSLTNQKRGFSTLDLKRLGFHYVKIQTRWGTWALASDCRLFLKNKSKRRRR
jgi:hypothetical protein